MNLWLRYLIDWLIMCLFFLDWWSSLSVFVWDRIWVLSVLGILVVFVVDFLVMFLFFYLDLRWNVWVGFLGLLKFLLRILIVCGVFVYWCVVLVLILFCSWVSLLLVIVLMFDIGIEMMVWFNVMFVMFWVFGGGWSLVGVVGVLLKIGGFFFWFFVCSIMLIFWVKFLICCCFIGFFSFW